MNKTNHEQDVFLAPSWIAFCGFAPNKLAPSVVRLTPPFTEWWPSGPTYLRYESTGPLNAFDVLVDNIRPISQDFPGANRIAVIHRPIARCEDLDVICMANWHHSLPTLFPDKTIWPIAQTNHASYFLIMNDDRTADIRIVLAEELSHRRSAPRLHYVQGPTAYRVPTLISDSRLIGKINETIATRSPVNALKALKDLFFTSINPTLDDAIVTGPADPLMQLKEQPLSVEIGTVEELTRAVEMACQLSGADITGPGYRFRIGKNTCDVRMAADPMAVQKLEAFIRRNLLPIFRPDGIHLEVKKTLRGIKSAYHACRPILEIPKSTLTSHDKIKSISALTRLLTSRGQLTQEAARQEVEALMTVTP